MNENETSKLIVTGRLKHIGPLADRVFRNRSMKRLWPMSLRNLTAMCEDRFRLRFCTKKSRWTRFWKLPYWSMIW